MTKPHLSLEEAEALHQSGQLEAAKEAYLHLLKTEPQTVRILHLLGILHAEEGDLNQAEAYLRQAIAADQHDDPSLTLHFANILKAKQAYPEAEQLLLQMTKAYPQFAGAYNNLGTVYFAEQKWQEAREAYEKAIAIQANYIDAYYNLGLVLGKLNQFEAAANAYQAILDLTADHPGAQFQMAKLLMQRGQYEKAYAYFSQLEKKHPFHFETQTNLATCALRLGRFDEAKTHYLKAFELVPDDLQILFNLGVMATQEGKLDEAADYYFKAVQHNPDFYDAQYNLGFIFLIKNDKTQALHHFREALRLHPGDKALNHMINILMQKKDIAASPPEYVKSLFDSYADHFEPHLKQFLHYQVPRVLFQTMQQVRKKDAPQWDILDIGCGTGLTGELFKPWARSLTGVDLSGKMLAIAAEKKIYDQLIESDIVPFLQGEKSHYDLIIAGDVIVYYGDLEVLLAAVHEALRPGGWFLFNTEINADEDYRLGESGRFAHSKDYIDRLSQSLGFQIKEYRVDTMRTQKHQAVQGHLYLLGKTF